ncbi:MAG TPA: hypothetical protein QF804_08150 [Rhodospirillales bacterium]|jgi:hypothetical protein|nr:hypothetical protein [Rhodospirillales bacterium]
MKAEGHRAKAERMGRSLEKLSPDDWEMVIDGVMLAVSHWINYAFHSMGLTADDENVMHAYFTTAFERQHWALAAGPELLDALAEIETIRPPHVRGDAPTGEAAARRALAILADVRERALAMATGQGREGVVRRR